MAWRPDETRWLDVKGKRLEARIWGPPPDASPTLVLLHEGLGSVGLWRNFPAALVAATGCGVFAWSRAGYGASDPTDLPRPLDYMEREAHDTLPLILDQIGAQKTVLIGHSDGASIAAVYCAAKPARHVKGLCLLAPHFFTEAQGLASIALAKLAYETGDLKSKLERHHSNVDNAFYGWNDAWLDPDFKGWNIERYLPGIKVPVLAIQGRDDQYGTLAQIEAIKRALTTSIKTLILENCRHSPQFERREATLAGICAFVSGLAF